MKLGQAFAVSMGALVGGAVGFYLLEDYKIKAKVMDTLCLYAFIKLSIPASHCFTQPTPFLFPLLIIVNRNNDWPCFWKRNSNTSSKKRRYEQKKKTWTWANPFSQHCFVISAFQHPSRTYIIDSATKFKQAFLEILFCT
ncbi:hypothetical protein BDB00DRAFT_95829 [Zychaea mexicana]|uniref:uncharacterized protein n=1 Tax=Zychaea mexicana TaxID=64656 RepID=UPI0022FF0CBF|nr:uncharacterized protein BDB00DRAFT_95829 [Zychaea mexicana]KAI9484953.1 hypothetical protein BDB00DRAFT_95829 [Zychaea mexicana]